MIGLDARRIFFLTCNLTRQPNELDAGQLRGNMRQYENLLATHLIAGLGGDQEAYRQFLKTLRSALRAHLQRKMTALRQHHLDVEDVVQEALMAVHRKSHTWDRETPVTAWISAIARYKLIDLMRRSRVTNSEVPLEYAAAHIASSDANPETRMALSQAMAILPSKMKMLIQLVKIEGLSVREAALEANSSEAAVKVSVHRAVKLIKGVLGQ